MLTLETEVKGFLKNIYVKSVSYHPICEYFYIQIVTKLLKKLLLFLAIVSVSISMTAQIQTGSWRLHVATMRAIDVAKNDEFIFTAYENGLMKYHIDSKEKKLLTVINGISDIFISKIFYDTLTEALFIGYKNGNIDKLINDKVINIPAIKLASISGSKCINRFYRTAKGLYIATDFGLVLLNPEKEEIIDTYYPTNALEGVVDLEVKDGIIYALTPTMMLFAPENSALLPAPETWLRDLRVPPFAFGKYAAIEQANNTLFVLAKSTEFGTDSVYKLLPTEPMFFSNYPSDLEISNLTNHNGYIDVLADGAILTYNVSGQVVESALSFYLGFYFRPNQMVIANQSKWVADDLGGLFRVIENFSYQKISYPGPPSNDSYALDWQKGKLAVASGRLEFKSPGFLKNGYYIMEDENWIYGNNMTIPQWQGIDIHDFIDVSINPKNPDEFAVSTYSAYPVSVLNAKENTCTVYDNSNSFLQPSLAGNGWYLASDVCYDGKGNLWVLNGWTDRPLVVKTSENVWWAYDCGTSARNKYTTKMTLDQNNNVWFATETSGLFGYNYGGTFDNLGDDKVVNISTAELSSIDINSSNITAIAVDLDNKIWIGTDAGFAVLYNPDAVFDALAGEYNPQRIKVNFEGNVEYVLGSTHITDIEVDGGNRKWIATASAGIVLLSPDGSEVIQQLTTENSPLLSNNVYDLKFNHDTGELFIITDKGLVSYRTDATMEDPNYATTKVFPNPVRPNYEGVITIQGIRYDSDVKVTDAAGNLVYKTTSNGGTATWDGKNLNGTKVTSGVYLIWTANNLGTANKVGKVVVVN